MSPALFLNCWGRKSPVCDWVSELTLPSLLLNSDGKGSCFFSESLGLFRSSAQRLISATYHSPKRSSLTWSWGGLFLAFED
ncbi:hypothetical protein BDV32DRAFT_127313, partial [Aspergillus pseudonomiae]